jgi:hypothetical protein
MLDSKEIPKMEGIVSFHVQTSGSQTDSVLVYYAAELKWDYTEERKSSDVQRTSVDGRLPHPNSRIRIPFS